MLAGFIAGLIIWGSPALIAWMVLGVSRVGRLSH